MTEIKPSKAPSCWGQKYQEGEIECTQCSYVDTCKLTMMNRVVANQRPVLPQVRVELPVLPQLPVAPVSQPLVPLPSKPFFSHIQTSTPQTIKPQTLAPMVSPQPPNYTPSYYQTNSNGYSLNNPINPNPLASMHRPGAQGPAYYLNHYPGESIGSRIFKNAILRALEAIFFELAQFFRHWTWP